MPGLLETLAEYWGKAVGTYRRAISQAEQRGDAQRPGFLTTWAESSQWTGGDLGEAEAAQRRAMANSWIFSGLTLIAGEVSSATFRVVQHTGPDNDPVQVHNHVLEQIVRRPNPFMSRSFLWFFTTFWMRLDGNAYWFIAPDENGRPAELWPLPSHQVDPWPGDRERFVEYYSYLIQGREYRLPPEYVVHFKNLPNPFDVFRGLSDLTSAMLAADSDMAMARWNGAFFGRDNVMPSAVINLSSGDPNLPINPVDAQRLRDDLRENYHASARKTAITTANSLTAVLLGWNAKDMDFLAGRQFSKEEIWSILGIPAGLMDKNATEANATVADRRFKENVWNRSLTPMAEMLTAQLVIPFYGEQYEAIFDDIRPANRILDMQEVAAGGPYLTIDEMRSRYWQLDPLPGGDGGRLAMTPALSPEPEPVSPELGGQSGAAILSAPAPTWSAELAQWRRKALHALKEGRSPAVKFSACLIPTDVAGEIEQRLADAETEEATRAAFEGLKASDPNRKLKQAAEGELELALEEYFNQLRRRILDQVDAAEPAA
jgi:HK97 family phage portal protein